MVVIANEKRANSGSTRLAKWEIRSMPGRLLAVYCVVRSSWWMKDLCLQMTLSSFLRRRFPESEHQQMTSRQGWMCTDGVPWSIGCVLYRWQGHSPRMFVAHVWDPRQVPFLSDRPDWIWTLQWHEVASENSEVWCASICGMLSQFLALLNYLSVIVGSWAQCRVRLSADSSAASMSTENGPSACHDECYPWCTEVLQVLHWLSSCQCPWTVVSCWSSLSFSV